MDGTTVGTESGFGDEPTEQRRAGRRGFRGPGDPGDRHRKVTRKPKRVSDDERSDLEYFLRLRMTLRPTSRSECRDGPRPCPWVGCQYHLWADVSGRTGNIKYNFVDLDPWELRETCACDLAERGDRLSLRAIGEVMNLTRERVRQIEEAALAKCRKVGGQTLLDMLQVV